MRIFVSALKKYLGDGAELYTSNQRVRDKGKHHITVVSASELAKEPSLGHIEGVEVSYTMRGVGSATKDGNTSYFIVVESWELKNIARGLNLPKRDYHVTIGFNEKDVFGVYKGKGTILFFDRPKQSAYEQLDIMGIGFGTKGLKKLLADDDTHVMNKDEAKEMRRIQSKTGLSEEEVRTHKKYRKMLSDAQKGNTPAA